MVITVGIKYHGNLPLYFNLRKSRYRSKLPWYFYNTGQKYHGILTLEKGGAPVNYRGIFITLVTGGNVLNPFLFVTDSIISYSVCLWKSFLTYGQFQQTFIGIIYVASSISPLVLTRVTLVGV
jgi:hypothetical protein